MKNKISMQVLMEAMNKLETEAYKDHVPGYGRGRGKSSKNWSMNTQDFAAQADHADRDDELDQAIVTMAADADTKPMRKPQSDEEEFIQSLLKVAEDMDFGGDTKTMTYDLADTQEDDAYDTTEMVGFVDAAADALATNLSQNMESFHGLSPEEMEDKVKSELMDVLKDMDATDLYDRS
jgi:hypothetical protein